MLTRFPSFAARATQCVLHCPSQGYRQKQGCKRNAADLGLAPTTLTAATTHYHSRNSLSRPVLLLFKLLFPLKHKKLTTHVCNPFHQGGLSIFFLRDSSRQNRTAENPRANRLSFGVKVSPVVRCFLAKSYPNRNAKTAVLLRAPPNPIRSKQCCPAPANCVLCSSVGMVTVATTATLTGLAARNKSGVWTEYGTQYTVYGHVLSLGSLLS